MSAPDAPLHERLLRRADMLTKLGYGGCDKELREAAAELRPPEGEVEALCERLEQWLALYGNSAVKHALDLRAALAHLRRLGQVEAALTNALGMIENCSGVPNEPDSLVQMVRHESRRAVTPQSPRQEPQRAEDEP